MTAMTGSAMFAPVGPNGELSDMNAFYAGAYTRPQAMYQAMKDVFIAKVVTNPPVGVKGDDLQVFQAFFALHDVHVLLILGKDGLTPFVMMKNNLKGVGTPTEEIPAQLIGESVSLLDQRVASDQARPDPLSLVIQNVHRINVMVAGRLDVATNKVQANGYFKGERSQVDSVLNDVESRWFAKVREWTDAVAPHPAPASA